MANRVTKLIFFTLTIFTAPVFAEVMRKPYSFDGFLIAEDVSNFSGGAKSGSVFNGVYHPIINYQFVNNASARVGLLAITNTQNQFLYTYASQSVSNMTAQRLIRLAELNYYQEINLWVDIRIGLMDLREYLNVYDVPKELINSGFGTNRVMSNATVTPTYPYPGFGSVVNLKHNDLELGLAAFQGNPQHQSTFFHDGAFFLEELGWSKNLELKHQPKLYLKLGSWQNYQPDPLIGYSNVGLYVMAQLVWLNSANQQINIMSQIGYGDKKANSLPYSFNFGLTISGIIPKRAQDNLGLGYSQVWLRGLSSERVFEIIYSIYITKNILIKPDLQYIVRPSGIKPNAFAGILRLIYNFDGHLLAKH